MTVLGACQHMGLVDSMVKTYHIEPNIRHYGCLVDLLGRRGLLREAEEVKTLCLWPQTSAHVVPCLELARSTEIRKWDRELGGS